MEIPKVGLGKFVVIIADYSTGHILNKDKSLYLNQGKDYFEVFEDEQTAFRYVMDLLEESNEIEAVIFNGLGEHLKTIRPAND